MCRPGRSVRGTWSRRARGRPAAGFTLVELLVTIGIISFVLSMAVLAFGPALRAAGTQSGAQRLRVALDTARVRAIQHRRIVRFEAQRTQPERVERPEAWVGTASASDAAVQWHALPEFVRVATNANGSWPAAPPALGNRIISVSFGPDGAVKTVAVDGVALPSLSEFLIRLQTTRSTATIQEKQEACQFIKITPLTGIVESFGPDDPRAQGGFDGL